MHSQAGWVRWCLSILDIICVILRLYVVHWTDWKSNKNAEVISLRSLRI